MLGRESLTHTEGMQLLRHSGLPIPFILQTDAVKAISPEGLPTAETVQKQLPLNDTEEKFEASLLQEPEPSPTELQNILTMINGLVPRVRQLLTDRAKQLPHDRGGRPEKISSAQEQQKIIEEIKKLREPGKKLKDIIAVVAQRYDVSPSKIKQVWYEHSESNSKDEKRPHNSPETAKPQLRLKKR